MKLKCDNCGKEYRVYPSVVKWNRIRKHKNNFCSSECSHEFRKGRKLVEYKEVICEYCKKKFSIPPYRFRDRRKRYKHLSCSRRCYHKWWKGRKASEETRRKISEANKGEKSGNWKGGITPVNSKIKSGLEYRLWRERVFQGDNYTCWICNARTYKGLGHRVELHPHHLKSFSEYPKLRFEVSNGLTLCRFCHKTYTNWGINQGK